jgi:hypothetical protein
VLTAIVGSLFFKEGASVQRLLGVALAWLVCFFCERGTDFFKRRYGLAKAVGMLSLSP